MLKITAHTDNDSTSLTLEGRLAGPWVEELERCWASSVGAKTRHPLSVDLSAVTYVDADGKDLLKKIYREGAKLVASGCLTNCIVEEITGGGRSDKGLKRPGTS
jgi:anti-anti-sigma regulatory factor